MDQKFYNEIRNILHTARNKVYQTANFAMVEAYWNIGEYYGAAEPPVRCGESHLSGLTEPPIDSYSA